MGILLVLPSFTLRASRRRFKKSTEKQSCWHHGRWRANRWAAAPLAPPLSGKTYTRLTEKRITRASRPKKQADPTVSDTPHQHHRYPENDPESAPRARPFHRSPSDRTFWRGTRDEDLFLVLPASLRSVISPRPSPTPDAPDAAAAVDPAHSRSRCRKPVNTRDSPTANAARPRGDRHYGASNTRIGEGSYGESDTTRWCAWRRLALYMSLGRTCCLGTGNPGNLIRLHCAATTPRGMAARKHHEMRAGMDPAPAHVIMEGAWPTSDKDRPSISQRQLRRATHARELPHASSGAGSQAKCCQRRGRGIGDVAWRPNIYPAQQWRGEPLDALPRR